MTRALPVALLAIAACVTASAGAKQPPDSGVKGRVTTSPTCPVEPYPPDPRCAPKGYETTIRIRTLPDRKLVKKVHTGKRGGFRTPLAPGRYVLRPRGGKNSFPSCPSQEVTVQAHKFVRVEITCDSGIR
jgi:hypothetical protein